MPATPPLLTIALRRAVAEIDERLPHVARAHREKIASALSTMLDVIARADLRDEETSRRVRAGARYALGAYSVVSLGASEALGEELSALAAETVGYIEEDVVEAMHGAALN